LGRRHQARAQLADHLLRHEGALPRLRHVVVAQREVPHHQRRVVARRAGVGDEVVELGDRERLCGSASRLLCLRGGPGEPQKEHASAENEPLHCPRHTQYRPAFRGLSGHPDGVLHDFGCVVRPPATVRTTLMSLIVSGATSCGSFSRITKSASLPGVIEPFCVSSYEAYAPWIVAIRSASSTLTLWFSPQTRPA